MAAKGPTKKQLQAEIAFLRAQSQGQIRHLQPAQYAPFMGAVSAGKGGGLGFRQEAPVAGMPTFSGKKSTRTVGRGYARNGVAQIGPGNPNGGRSPAQIRASMALGQLAALKYPGLCGKAYRGKLSPASVQRNQLNAQKCGPLGARYGGLQFEQALRNPYTGAYSRQPAVYPLSQFGYVKVPPRPRATKGVPTFQPPQQYQQTLAYTQNPFAGQEFQTYAQQ